MNKTKIYHDAHAIARAGIPFNECLLEGQTEYTNTDVYSFPDKYAERFSAPSLKVVGCWGTSPADGIFTEEVK